MQTYAIACTHARTQARMHTHTCPHEHAFKAPRWHTKSMPALHAGIKSMSKVCQKYVKSMRARRAAIL